LVRALVIMDATPGGVPPAVCEWLTGASAALASGDKVRRDDVFREALARMFSPSTHRDRPEVVEYARVLFESHDPAGLALALRVPLSYTSINDRLGTLKLPTLVGWGSDDAGSPIALARHYLDAIDGSQGI